MFKKTKVMQIIELLQKKIKRPGNFKYSGSFQKFRRKNQSNF